MRGSTTRNLVVGLGVAAALGAGAPSARAQVYEVEVLEDSGPSDARIDFVIMGDGYPADYQHILTEHASFAMSMLWDSSPFEDYRGFINAKLIHVISEEAGADFGTDDVKKDTALDGIYVDGTRHLVVNNGKAAQVAIEHTPEADLLMVIVNDKKYGGTGGNVAVISASSTAPLIAIHELGHTLANLADEYETERPGYPPCGAECPEPNVTTVREYKDIKWNAWIDPNTPVPTPEDAPFFDDKVGLFEGARYVTIGVFRPKKRCMMRSHLDQEAPAAEQFCEICREALILSFYDFVPLIDATAPEGPLELGAGETVALSVTTPAVDPQTLVASWLLPSGEVAAVGPSWELPAEALGVGDHEVRVRVDDTTEMVRSDPDGTLSQEASWQVTVSGVSCAQDSYCFIDGACLDPEVQHPDNPCLECDPAQARVSWSGDDTNSCDDGDYCNGAETCQGGVCLPGPAPCDDSLFCNGAETCSAGACQDGAPPCADDGLGCTVDCVEETDTCHTLDAGFCLIDGVCYADGEASADDPEAVCQVETDTTSWTTVPCEGDCGGAVADEGSTGGAADDGCRLGDAAAGAWWVLPLLALWLCLAPTRRRRAGEVS